jgi:hypothetical protein
VATMISTEKRLDELEQLLETVLQLVERLIDHVLPSPNFSEEYKAENAQALMDWPGWGGNA